MNIYEAIADVMKQGAFVGKDSKNQQQGFNYRGIDAVMNTFQPLMAERGIFVVPEVIEQVREERTNSKGTRLLYSILKMRYTFYAEDGSSVSAVVIGEGMDSGDKASNKAMAVAMKYAMFQVFCIPTEEMRDADPDKESPDEIAPAAPAKPAAAKPATAKKAADTAQKAPEAGANKDKAVTIPAPGEDGNWHCEKCKAVILPYVDGNNQKHLPKEIIEASVRRLKKVLCYDCMAKGIAEKKNAKA